MITMLDCSYLGTAEEVSYIKSRNYIVFATIKRVVKTGGFGSKFG